MFDQSAIQPVKIEPHDLFWRIKNFFRLIVESGLIQPDIQDEVLVKASPTEVDHGWTEPEECV
jgi:hypothetical protein